MDNRAGKYKKNLAGELQYMSFEPKPLPPVPAVKMDTETISLLSSANRNIGILEGLSEQIPNIELFVYMYVRKEALLSSQIEGTQATLDDVLDPKITENKNKDVADVLNYIKASQYALTRLEELPISSRLIKETHKILMKNVRGDERNPGEFRRTQNWIGPAGSTLKTASYIPPNPEDMTQAISDLDKFINMQDEIEPLIKIALIHYQFETIHPFLDGNGRIGRLLINLFLVEKKLLTYETLYISYFFKRNRTEYYDRLMKVRNKGYYEQWVRFFLLAINESAIDSIETIRKMVALHDKNIKLISETGRASKTIFKVFTYLEGNPIIDITKTSIELEMSYNAIANAVESLIDLRILEQTEDVQRNRVFAYEEYLAILRKDT